jgi:hybrid cluster-associated redox disulfide protein
MKDKKQKITKKMTFSEILEKKPESAEILLNEGMHCIGCPMSQMETLEQGCAAHGVDVEKVLDKLNKG